MEIGCGKNKKHTENRFVKNENFSFRCPNPFPTIGFMAVLSYQWVVIISIIDF